MLVLLAGLLSFAVTKAPASENAVPPASKHRIGVRVVGGDGQLYDRATGRRFVPRGVNYHLFVRESGLVVDTLFARWSRARVTADLKAIKAQGYNTVRTSVDLCGRNCIGNPAGGLRARYLDRVAEFLKLADAHGLQVILTSNDLPLQGGFVPRVEATCCGTFDGYINSHYLSPVGFETYRAYWVDVVRGLVRRKAPLRSVLSFTVRGELWLFADKPPLSLTAGRVKTANGRTYALPTDSERMVDDGVRYWIAGIRAAIRKFDPTALVSVGMFAPNAPSPWRPPTDSRAVPSVAVLTSAADFVDLHPYPGYLRFDELMTNFRVDPTRSRKPIVLGEWGGFRFAYETPAKAARAVMDWQVESCRYGFDGWAHWHWRGANDAEVWTGTDGGGLMNRVLSPRERPDPCRGKAFPFLDRNLALGRQVSVSAQLPGSQGSLAVDGSRSTGWGSGAGPPGWIEVELEGPSTVRAIRLVVDQFPSGRTIHTVSVRAGGAVREVHRFDGATEIGQVLAWSPDAPLTGVTAVRVETLASPSFVSWYEVEVLG